jgi:hypothetical protein
MHRQPTPNSVANAEVGLGEASGKDVEAFEREMDRAVTANEANNLAECENALAEARRIFLGPKTSA